MKGLVVQFGKYRTTSFDELLRQDSQWCLDFILQTQAENTKGDTGSNTKDKDKEEDNKEDKKDDIKENKKELYAYLHSRYIRNPAITSRLLSSVKEKGSTELLDPPSLVTDAYWLFASNEHFKHSAYKKSKPGKWMLFFDYVFLRSDVANTLNNKLKSKAKSNQQNNSSSVTVGSTQFQTKTRWPFESVMLSKYSCVPTQLDYMWALIEHCCAEGWLNNFGAKVSTAMPRSKVKAGTSQGVIIVYTYDCEDREDVLRVAQRIRNYVTADWYPHDMRYKSDEQTRSHTCPKDKDRRRRRHKVTLYYHKLSDPDVLHDA